MNTLRLNLTTEDIKIASQIIREGGLVAFPTETVYGLGADALNAEAVKSVYVAKGRPSDNPMIVHIADMEALERVAKNPSARAIQLADRFWPGPLTMVFERQSVVPDVTTGGLDTVAVRMPSNETARELIRGAGTPIAAPSANLSGKPSPTTCEDVLEDMDGRIDAVVMGARSDVGIESTVLDMTGDKPVILRPGKVTKDDMEEVLGIVVCYDEALLIETSTEFNPEDGAQEDKNFRPRSPGMKYKHYAPKAKVRLVHGDMDSLAKAAFEEGIKVAKLDYGTDSEAAARYFFADLRRLDREGVELILVETLETPGFGFSIMNRMLKSAGYDVVDNE